MGKREKEPLLFESEYRDRSQYTGISRVQTAQKDITVSEQSKRDRQKGEKQAKWSETAKQYKETLSSSVKRCNTLQSLLLKAWALY